MSESVTSFKPEDNLVEALRQLVKKNHSGAPVLDNEGRLVGMLSEIDCLKEALMDGYFQSASDRVADHMTKEVDFVQASDNILVLADIFIGGRRRVPVLEDGVLVGIITRQDFARALIYKIDHPHHGDHAH
jgi:predicted transcriptional regulator